MKLGTNDIGSVYLGTNAVSAVYLGTNLVWSGMDADYKAVLDYATTQGYTLPSASQQLLQEQVVVDLKSAGIWNKLDAFYIMATDGDSDYACINYIDQNNFNLIKLNSVTFTTDQGFKGDGISASLDTSMNLGVNTSNFDLNTRNASFGGWSYSTKAISANSLMGDEANRNTIRGGSQDYIMGGTPASSNRITGLYHLNSYGLVCEQYQNGQLITSSSNNNLTSTNNLHLLSEGGVTFSIDDISIAFVGGDLSSEASDLYDILNSYITSI